MSLVMRGILVLAVAGLLIGVLVFLIYWLLRRRHVKPGYWRRVARLHIVLVPLYVFVFPSLVLVLVFRYSMGTRSDERTYEGPRVDAAGSWTFQDRHTTLRRESTGELTVAPEVRAGAREREVRLATGDGVSLRAFLVEAVGEPRFGAVLVHGLFRNAMELEPAASMLHRLGGDVLLLEMRNHGGSGRAVPTFGKNEALDVVAGAHFLRSRERTADLPLILYGVSLGAAATALAAPNVKNLGGVILDAPMDSLERTFHNLLRDGHDVPQPYRSLVLFFLEVFCGFKASDVRPVDAAGKLDPSIPVLVIGAGRDFRTPPDVVRQVFDSLNTDDEISELWIVDGAEHAKVWEKDRVGYRERMTSLVERVLSRGSSN